MVRCRRGRTTSGSERHARERSSVTCLPAVLGNCADWGMMMLEKKETLGRELLEAAGGTRARSAKEIGGGFSLMKENGIEMTKE